MSASNRKRVAAAALLVAAVLGLSGCNTTGMGGPKQGVGAVIGGIGGGVIGSQFGKGNGKIAMTVLGTLLGTFVGNEVGASLDRADRMYMGNANYDALERAPTNATVQWRNPDSGNYGSITPTRTFQTASGYCREFQQTVYVGGRQQQAYGTACRQPDGTWQIQG